MSMRSRFRGVARGARLADGPPRVMCEMVGAVDPRVLGAHVGDLTLDEMRTVDGALELVLDLG